jgi:hypothetical protein
MGILYRRMDMRASVFIKKPAPLGFLLKVVGGRYKKPRNSENLAIGIKYTPLRGLTKIKNLIEYSATSI